MISESIVERIVALRKAGHTCRETADIVGVSESSVWGVMRRRGLNGKIRAYRKCYHPPASVGAAVHEYGSILIEEGLNGGYVATIEDVYTSGECGSLAAAIRSAARKAGRRE